MAKKKKSTKKRTLGELEPRHHFFLNPYISSRFTKCPKCDAPTKIRKRPFGVHVDPSTLLALNMSGPYCPDCDLIILHQDKVEALLTARFLDFAPNMVGNDYLIIGTIDRSYWREVIQDKGTSTGFLENLHDFEKVVIFEPVHYVWAKDDD